MPFYEVKYVINRFTREYLGTALWCTSDMYSCEDDSSLESLNYDVDDFSKEAYMAAKADCKDFLSNPRVKKILREKDYDLDLVAHDFWLTRNGHGAGFWDGDYDEEDGEVLTAISEPYGEVNLYVGDDDRIWSV